MQGDAIEIAKEILSRDTTQYEGRKPLASEILAEAVLKLSEENENLKNSAGKHWRHFEETLKEGKFVLETCKELTQLREAVKEAKEIIVAVSNGENNRQGDAIDWKQKYGDK